MKALLVYLLLAEPMRIKRKRQPMPRQRGPRFGTCTYSNRHADLDSLFTTNA